MFKCGQCGKNSIPKEKPERLAIETRKKVYDKKYKGWEIVKEILLCQECQLQKVMEELASTTPSNPEETIEWG